MAKEVWWFDESGERICYDSIQDFMEAQRIDRKTANEWIRAGYKAVMEALEKGNKTLVIADRTFPRQKPVKMNSNRIVRVFHPELDKLLEWLAKCAKTSYQEAFEEFVIYIREGHLWASDSAMVLKERLMKRSKSKGRIQFDYEDTQEETPRSRVAELLEPYILELEAKVQNLENRNTRLEDVVQRMRVIMQESEE